MENKKLGTEPAFPTTFERVNEIGRSFTDQEYGISKRLYIAIQIVSSIADNSGINIECDVNLAYKYVDELLKQETL